MTVKLSLPLGVPERPMPNVTTLPLIDILVGVALDSVAFPPLKAKLKSLVCKAPLPPAVVYTASLKVTAMVLLSEARETAVWKGSPVSMVKVVMNPS